jgi:hypothetical protein
LIGQLLLKELLLLSELLLKGLELGIHDDWPSATAGACLDYVDLW